MNFDVTVSTTSVLRILIVCWTRRFVGSYTMVHAMTRQAEVIHTTELQHSGICRAVRNVTRHASIDFHRSMFESKWTLLVGMTLQTRRISTYR